MMNRKTETVQLFKTMKTSRNNDMFMDQNLTPLKMFLSINIIIIFKIINKTFRVVKFEIFTTNSSFFHKMQLRKIYFPL